MLLRKRKKFSSLQALRYKISVKPHIGPQHMKIRKGQPIMLEVGHIIPDIDPITNPAPARQIFLEGCAASFFVFGKTGALGAAFQRMAEAALNGAQAHAYIVPGAGNPGRPAGILIGQGIHHNPWKLRLNAFCYIIYKTDQRASMASLFLVDSGTFRAFTGGISIVL